YVVSSVAALGGLLFGYDIGIMSSILQMELFIEYFDRPGPLATGVIVSSLTIGCFIGSLLSAPLADRFSRKRTIMLGALVCNIGSAIQFGSINRAMLIAGRFVNGLAVGFLSSVVPMYQSETAPPENRGRMVSLQQWAITWGIFLAFGIDYGCSFIKGPKQFRLPLGLQIVPSIILLFTMVLMPFSPRWLVAHNYISDARRVLGRLRTYGHASAPEVQEELRLIHETIVHERETMQSSYWDLLKYPNRRRTLLGCGMQFMQQFTGINTLMLYAPTIFRDIGLNSIQSIALCQAINGLVNVISTVPAIFTNWIANFVVTLLSPVLLHAGGWKLIMAFSLVMVVNLTVIFLFLPETKGMSLEDMDSVFMGSIWAFKYYDRPEYTDEMVMAVIKYFALRLTSLKVFGAWIAFDAALASFIDNYKATYPHLIDLVFKLGMVE
ncbi:hypothetical protein GGH96_000093, partial [Coemansia sp. RSA 1972]